LGSGRMIPGFEDGIVGVEAGSHKTLHLKFPDDYHKAELKGADVEFKITVNSVLQLIPAELDENLFAKYGVTLGGEEQFRKEVADNMARELKNAVEAKVKQQVMDAVLEAYKTLEVPKALVDQEIVGMRNQMFQQFGGAGNQGLDLKTLLPDTMFSENAERRVKLGLILAEIIAKHELKADKIKIRESIEEMASTYEDPQEVIDYYYSNQHQLATVESKVLEDQVVEFLLGSANITEHECSYQEAISR
jgi:trigger factor